MVVGNDIPSCTAVSRICLRLIVVAALALAMGLGSSCSDMQPIMGSAPPDDDSTNGGGDESQDSLPPQAVSDPSLTYCDSAMEAYLEWTAPCDDSLEEAVSRYEIRFSYTSPLLWGLSIPIIDPPAPKAPGERQRYTFRYPQRGKTLLSAIKCVDEAGNRSRVDSIAWVHIPGYTFLGLCVNVLSGLPIEGMAVNLLFGASYDLTTDINGRFSRSDLCGGAGYITISTGNAQDPYHTLGKRFEIMADISRTFLMIPFQRTESQRFANLLQLFKILTKTDGSIGGRTVLTTWARRPVKCHIPSFVNSEGVDYRAEGLRAAERWMEKTDLGLFTFVDSPPDTGVTFHFKSRSEMGIHIGITHYTNGSDGLPLRDDIDLVDDMPNSHSLYLICMHELGHTLRLGHLPFPEFIMFEGQPLPPDISADEAEVVRLLVRMPSRIDMAAYDETNPE